MKSIVVAGAGRMGGGIAQVCAQAGYSVAILDVNREALEKALEGIEWSVGKLIEKGKIKGDRAEIMSRITIGDMPGDVDLAIEAVFEDVELKREVFQKLDEACPSNALLATNTSAIPVTDLAAATKRPEKVLGLHFFNPVPMMKAVEVIRGIRTSDETMSAAGEFVRSLDKEPIIVNRDIAGFVLNRINLPSTIEAIRLVEAGVATVEDIDKGMRLGFGRPMGPFETGDMVGLDVTFGALTAIYNETRDPRFYPPTLLQRKVKAGHLGKKTGRGWYEYDENGNRKS